MVHFIFLLVAVSFFVEFNEFTFQAADLRKSFYDGKGYCCRLFTLQNGC